MGRFVGIKRTKLRLLLLLLLLPFLARLNGDKIQIANQLWSSEWNHST
jgi:hypothetical protein